MASRSTARKAQPTARTSSQPPAGQCPVHQSGFKEEDFPAPQADGKAPCGLIFYQIHHGAAEIRPAQAQRSWMDETPNRFAYRCLPLSIANATGWELLLPFGFRAFWNGGAQIEDIRLEAHDPKDAEVLGRMAGSHFGSGVITFHTGFIMRTSPGWGLWARGAPNDPRDGIAALDGLIETDWLPFPFTMNWKFTRPGMVEFHKGDVFCFVTPTPHHSLEAISPSVVPLDMNQPLRADYERWAQARESFNARLDAGDPEAIKQGWQRNYMHGRTLDGERVPIQHATKRKMKAPKGL
ncbi:MAG: hypothetical protein KI785_06925 [Devosiaceae bacterium]|nr:hypothetical protein [Devosiaceae bacterium MH13]